MAKGKKSDLVDLVDKSGHINHDLFQDWRGRNQDGFVLNCQSMKKWMLHRVDCPHFGSTEFNIEDECGSLTKTRKICSNRVDALRLQAKEEKALVTDCFHCFRKGT